MHNDTMVTSNSKGVATMTTAYSKEEQKRPTIYRYTSDKQGMKEYITSTYRAVDRIINSHLDYMTDRKPLYGWTRMSDGQKCRIRKDGSKYIYEEVI